MTFVSYAQNFEDVMLYRALKHVRHGFYVDVGAQHPVKDSVTKAFSLAGWRGINIEPVKRWYEMLEADRPYDVNLNVAVAEQEGFLELFDVEGTGLSTTDPAFAERHRAAGHRVSGYRVPTVTLDSIFAEHGVHEVHFLKVDCEGAERTALASCSFQQVRPWVVTVEATEPNSQVDVHEQWESLLVDRGYVLAYRDGLNRYYVAQEHAELLPSFDLPPNVFDDFVRVEDKKAHDEVNEVHVRLRASIAESAEARQAVSRLSEHLQSLDALHAGQLEERDLARRQAVSECESVKTQLEQARAALASLEGQLQHVRARIGSEIEEAARGYLELQREAQLLRAAVAHRDEMIGAFVSSASWRVTAPLRGASLIGRAGLRRCWKMVRPAVARAARAARPAVRGAMAVPGVRPAANALLGPDTRLGRRARAFLSRGHVSVAPDGPVAMSDEAVVAEALLHIAIAKRKK
jgi:FkbM family methyltransferase